MTPTLLHHGSGDWTVDGRTGCWNWAGRKDEFGYGHCTAGRAHRVVWVQSGRELDPSHDLHHRCQNTSCVNPDHLEPVTRSEHLTAHGQMASHLTWDDVREIRRIHTAGGTSIAELGMRYGLGKSQIHNIVANVKWHDPAYKPGRLIACAECGSEFVATKHNERFCTKNHRIRWNDRRRHRIKVGLDPDYEGDYRKRAA